MIDMRRGKQKIEEGFEKELKRLQQAAKERGSERVALSFAAHEIYELKLELERLKPTSLEAAAMKD